MTKSNNVDPVLGFQKAMKEQISAGLKGNIEEESKQREMAIHYKRLMDIDRRSDF